MSVDVTPARICRCHCHLQSIAQTDRPPQSSADANESSPIHRKILPTLSASIAKSLTQTTYISNPIKSPAVSCPTPSFSEDDGKDEICKDIECESGTVAADVTGQEKGEGVGGGSVDNYWAVRGIVLIQEGLSCS